MLLLNNTKNVVVLASGGGTNLQALIDAEKRGELGSGKITCVIASKADAYALIERLRAAVPDLALRTTLLVGYPDETEEDFAELMEFVEKVRFERLGVFPYSEEEGTFSARELEDNVPEDVKQERVDRVMALQNRISLEKNQARVGQREQVIIDSRQGDWYVARGRYDSPEVDQEILIPASERQLRRGKIYTVEITGAEEYDLYASVVAK